MYYDIIPYSNNLSVCFGIYCVKCIFLATHTPPVRFHSVALIGKVSSNVALKI